MFPSGTGKNVSWDPLRVCGLAGLPGADSRDAPRSATAIRLSFDRPRTSGLPRSRRGTIRLPRTGRSPWEWWSLSMNPSIPPPGSPAGLTEMTARHNSPAPRVVSEPCPIGCPTTSSRSIKTSAELPNMWRARRASPRRGAWRAARTGRVQNTVHDAPETSSTATTRYRRAPGCRACWTLRPGMRTAQIAGHRRTGRRRGPAHRGPDQDDEHVEQDRPLDPRRIGREHTLRR